MAAQLKADPLCVRGYYLELTAAQENFLVEGCAKGVLDSAEHAVF